MRLALFAFLLLPGLAQAFPLTEADYLAQAEAVFTAADKNHDGALERDEVIPAFKDGMGELKPSAATMQICQQNGKAIATQYNYKDGMEARDLPADFKPMTRADYLKTRDIMFQQYDSNHDKTVTLDEAAAFDTRMARMCQNLPAMMQNLQGIKEQLARNPQLSQQMREKILQGMQKMQGAPQGAPQGVPVQ